MSSLLDIRSLTIAFPGQARPAVEDVSLSLEAGEVFCLLGESGSGKTLTALSVPRLLPVEAVVTDGSVHLAGQSVLDASADELRRLRGGTVGYVFQEPQSALNPVMTVGEQIAEAVRAHRGLSHRAARLATIELLDRVGIRQPSERVDDYPHQYSGGMKQRALIAMAIAGEPRLLVADEPTTALDATLQAQILDLLRALCRDAGMGLLFITHDLGVARRMSDRIAVMSGGRVVESAPARTLFEAPQSDYTRALFAAWPRRSLRVPKPSLADAPLVLEVADLSVAYRGRRRGILGRASTDVVVRDVSFRLVRGETLAVVGESGSGKTTLARAVLGLIPAQGGRMGLDGRAFDARSLARERQLRARLQIVFQDPYASMNPRMTIEQVVGEGLAALQPGLRGNERRARIVEAVEAVGLDAAVLERYPHEFSGGQRQRLCIARALVLEPGVLVCDEPTSALDATVQWQVLGLLRELQRSRGTAYLFITHNFSVVEYFADRVVVMHQGRVVEQGTVDEVLDHPREDYTRQLLAAVPRWGEGLPG
jgi:ABC-type microcin C transport system duplicated ATPase subunit YejF